MADTNAFEELRRENEAKFERIDNEVKKNVAGRKDFWTLLSELVELFIPRIFTTLLGINDKDTKKR